MYWRAVPATSFVKHSSELGTLGLSTLDIRPCSSFRFSHKENSFAAHMHTHTHAHACTQGVLFKPKPTAKIGRGSLLRL